MIVRYFDYDTREAWYYISPVEAPCQAWDDKVLIALEEEFMWNRYWAQKEYLRTIGARMN